MSELYAALPQKPRGGVYYDRRTTANLAQWEKKVAASRVVYVGNLNFSTTEDELYELFAQAGLVRRVVMGLNKITKEPCGFAFVEFFHPFEAKNAQLLLSGCCCDGRVIRVDADSGESVEDHRKFGRGFTGRQWRDEYREEFDVGRGGEGRKKRVRAEYEAAEYALQQQQQQFFPPPPIAAAVVAQQPTTIYQPVVGVPPPPPPVVVVAGGAAAAPAVCYSQASRPWERNVRARKKQALAKAAAPQSLPPTVFVGPPAPPAPADASSTNFFGGYLQLVQHAQQQQQVNPFAAAPVGGMQFNVRGRVADRENRGNMKRRPLAGGGAWQRW